MRPERRGRRWSRDERGGVAVLGAVVGGLLCTITALAVDIGSMALHARTLQGAADLAALAAVSDMPKAHAAAEATARANLSRSMVEGLSIQTRTGAYRAERALAPDARFKPTSPTPMRRR